MSFERGLLTETFDAEVHKTQTLGKTEDLFIIISITFTIQATLVLDQIYKFVKDKGCTLIDTSTNNIICDGHNSTCITDASVTQHDSSHHI